jgi:DNA polymerase-3 subunit alpha
MTKKELIKSLKKKSKELSEKEQLYLDEEIKAFTVQTDDVDKILEMLDNNIVSDTNANNILSLYLLGIAPYPEKLKHKYELADMLDIDLDFAPDGRDTIKQYLSETYGKENCVSIGTYGTLGVKGSVQEVSRVFNIPPSEYIKVSKAVSDDDKDLSVDEIKEKYSVVKKFLANHPEVENSITKLTGMKKSIGKHAGGFVVSSDSVFENIPVVKSHGEYVSGWQESGAVKELEALGFIKVDILGLACVEQISRCANEVKENHPEAELPEDIYDVPIDDQKVYDFINTLKLDNVFQMESKVFREAVRKIQPQSLSEISNISTLIRPGAACSVDEYANSKLDKTKTPKCLWHVFDHTRGWLIYQEQLMQVVMELGGFSIFEADKVRRLVRKIGKSKTSDENRQSMLDEAEEYHKIYLESATKKIIKEDEWSEKDAKDYAERQWQGLMGQARYCLDGEELVKLANGKKKRAKHLKIGDEVLAYTNNKFQPEPIVQLHNNGKQTVYEFTTNKGTKVKCTGNHKFLTRKGLKTLLEIWNEDLEILEKSDFELKVF